MSTLFFEGFDKGVIFNELDPKYWSTQFRYFPKYAFGGYAPYTIEDLAIEGGPTPDKLGFLYKYSTPASINGLVPSGRYTDNRANNNAAYVSTDYTKNSYPGFGSPPGFLAFTNIELENSTSVEYPTYLQASGFPVSTGSIYYLSMRCLGLESKHSDYSIYPHRHILFSFNSGNLPLLTVNVVKITGDNLSSINAKKETLALEIQQNNQTIGFFDLNLYGDVNQYKIASVFNSNNNKILTIADTNQGLGFSSMISRWCHLEFSVDKSTDIPQLYINAEDVNLQVVDPDPTVLKELWNTSLPISGFTFDNLRFYNRTYSSAVMTGVTPSLQGEQNWQDSWYYMRGRVWLLDDLVLIDNADPPPSYWLGSSAKVISIYPGISGSLRDNYGSSDGLLKWFKDPSVRTISAGVDVDDNGVPYINNTSDWSSHRRAFLIPDKDGNFVETTDSGNIDAIKMTKPNYLINNTFNSFDSNSVWRTNFNDAIGGMKVYNSARKKYLDTKFINVFYSGQSDIYEPNISLLLHGESNPIKDNSTLNRSISISGSARPTADTSQIGIRSINFPDMNSYLSLDHPDLSSNIFTIESWVYFPDATTSISLFDKTPDPNVNYYSFRTYSLAANISGIQYISDFKTNDDGDGGYTTVSANVKRQLFFPSIAATGTWHHIAITRNDNSGIICYLNGQSGNSYQLSNSGSVSSFTTIENTGFFNSKYTILSDYNNFNSSFTIFNGSNSQSVNRNLTLGKGGYIDEFRMTTGINRYPTNFSVPTSAFKSQADDYCEVGPIHTVTKTTYKTYQYYINQNPISQQNWKLSEVTGIIFGVKKL